MGVEDNPLYFGATALPIIRTRKNFPYQKRIDALKASSCNQAKTLPVLSSKILHISEKSQPTPLSNKSAKTYSCKSCGYFTSKKGMFNLHQSTVHGNNQASSKKSAAKSDKLHQLLSVSNKLQKTKVSKDQACDSISAKKREKREKINSKHISNVSVEMEANNSNNILKNLQKSNEMNVLFETQAYTENDTYETARKSGNRNVHQHVNKLQLHCENGNCEIFPQRHSEISQSPHKSFWNLNQPVKEKSKSPDYICETCAYKCDLWKFKDDRVEPNGILHHGYHRINLNSYSDKNLAQFTHNSVHSLSHQAQNMPPKISHASDFCDPSATICVICGKASTNMEGVIIPDISASTFNDIDIVDEPSKNDYEEFDKAKEEYDKFTHIKDEMSVGLELFIRKMDADIEEFAQKYPEEVAKYITNDYKDYKNATGFIDTVVQIRSGKKITYQERINALTFSSKVPNAREVQNKQDLNSITSLCSSQLHSSSCNSPISNVVECIDELIRKNYHAIK